MKIVDRLKSSYSFLGDPLHREAWMEIEKLQGILEECAIYFDNYADVVDGDNGPEANPEMALLQMIQFVLED